ncbi:lipoprotein [Erysipelothrix aquatica]|uniref:lipoprotein n=1 Tax=Erysipelothrix aquatica TaxID=2683714 RepID=UPI00135B6816|nr:lipoprotein [Erysipelothrix aquatica]
MKKITALLVALLVLAGCSDARVKPASNETIFTVGNQTVTETQLFEVMKRQDNGATVIQNAEQSVTKDINDPSIEEAAQAQLAEAKSILGDQFPLLLEQLNMGSEQDYLDKVVYPTLKMEFLVKQTIEADFDTLVKEYQPRKANIVQIQTVDQANEALTRIQAGEKMEDVAKDVTVANSQYTGKSAIYNLKGTQFPSPVSQFMNQQQGPGLSGVLKDETNGTAYIVEIVETDANKFKDDLLNQWKKDQALTKTYRAKVFSDNNFKVYDKDILDAVTKSYPGYLA